jgi:uncharacterized protein YraI
MRRQRQLAVLGVSCFAAMSLAPAAPARASGDSATVHTGGTPLRVRGGPGTSFARLGVLRSGTRIWIACSVRGENIHGRVRTSAQWDLLEGGGYVAHAYVATARAVPPCPATLPGEPAAFIAAAAPLARSWARRYALPTSVAVAQAILESGWGRSALARVANNLFGSKCFGGAPGPIATGCRPYPTSECGRSGCHPDAARFRAYRRPADSFQDYARLLASVGRYRVALRYRHAPERFAVELQRAGYATDPRYAAKLIGLMRRYGLYRFDR